MDALRPFDLQQGKGCRKWCQIAISSPALYKKITVLRGTGAAVWWKDGGSRSMLWRKMDCDCGNSDGYA